MPTTQLSLHFTLAELTHSDTAVDRGIDNTPDAAQSERLKQLCNQTLEPIRQLCNSKPVVVSSGFRSQALNRAVGGVPDSAHASGDAADITVPDFGTPLAVCRTLLPRLEEFEIDQLIYESNSQGHVWVHVGRARPGQPRRGQAFSLHNGAYSTSPFPG